METRKVLSAMHLIGSMPLLEVKKHFLWTREWAALSKKEEKTALIKNSQRLEGLALEFFHKARWNLRRRIYEMDKGIQGNGQHFLKRKRRLR